MKLVEPVEPVELTKDMIGDAFETREGELVFMTVFRQGLDSAGHRPHPDFPARFTDGWRTHVGNVYISNLSSRRDINRHLPKSEYPEYYL